MKKEILCWMIIPIILSSCASNMKTSYLRPDDIDCIQLPNLEPRMDLQSLESMYPVSSIVTTDDSNVSTVSTSKNPGAQDLYILFEREVRDCLTNPYGETKGYIYCQFTSTKIADFNFHFCSPFFLYIPNLLGMPLARAKTNIELDVEIYTQDNKLIGRYNGNGYNKSYSAVWYGYRLQSLNRVVAIKAFKMALNEVKQKIAADRDRLMAELNKE